MTTRSSPPFFGGPRSSILPSDGNEPYVVPLHFVYLHDQIYLHSAQKGRKMDIVAKNPRACFGIEEGVEILPAPTLVRGGPGSGA